MELGKLHCANEKCEKAIGQFPLESLPEENLEVYCEECAKLLKDKEEEKCQK